MTGLCVAGEPGKIFEAPNVGYVSGRRISVGCLRSVVDLKDIFVGQAGREKGDMLALPFLFGEKVGYVEIENVWFCVGDALRWNKNMFHDFSFVNRALGGILSEGRILLRECCVGQFASRDDCGTFAKVVNLKKYVWPVDAKNCIDPSAFGFVCRSGLYVEQDQGCLCWLGALFFTVGS